MLTKRKPTPADVIDLRERLEAKVGCPNCDGTDWTQRLTIFECVACGFRLGEAELPPLP